MRIFPHDTTMFTYEAKHKAIKLPRLCNSRKLYQTFRQQSKLQQQDYHNIHHNHQLPQQQTRHCEQDSLIPMKPLECMIDSTSIIKKNPFSFY